MTSLANQLKSLALPHTQAILGNERKRVSLLFDPTEAANLDKEAIFAIGIGGLEELVEIDGIFMEYQKSLFNESASSLQRLTQTSEVNKKLDETVKLFLIHLSPYFLLKPAHKTLEWLIYRYQIHFYNIDELLMCGFPYHDSNIFTRLLQILNLSDSKSKWHWLEQVQKHGTQLPTQTIAMHAYKDEGFLNFVSSIPERFIDVHGYEKSGGRSPVHAAVAFYTKIALSSVHIASVIKESFIAQLTTFLLKGLKSRNDEYKCSSYMILSSLCSKVSLDQKFLESILPLLTKRMTMRNGLEAITCLVFVLKTQPSLTSFPKRCFKHMCRLPGIVQHLNHLHDLAALDSFWQPLLKHLVPAAIKDCRLGVTSSSDGGGAGGELIAGKPEYWSLLESLLSDCVLKDSDAAVVIELMCNGYVENKQACHTEESQALLAERVQAMLRLMEQKYSKIVDAEIQRQMESSEDNELMQEFALMSISSFKYKGDDTGASMTLSLNSPTASIRVQGVKKLAQLLEDQAEDGVDKMFVSDTLYARLLDDDVKVANAVLKINEEYLYKYLSAQQLVALIKSTHHSKICISCCKLLSGHPDVKSVTDDITKLAMIMLHDERLEMLNILTSIDLPLLRGLVLEKDNYREDFLNTLGRNIACEENPSDQVEMLLDDKSACIPHTMCAVLVSIVDMDSVSSEIKEIALAHLIKQHQVIVEQMKREGSLKTSFNSITSGIIRIFQEWTGGWTTQERVIKLYHTFMANLIGERQVNTIVTIVNTWMKVDIFDYSFVLLVTRGDDSLTLNLVHLLLEIPDEILQGLALTIDGKLTMGCLLSLLMSEEKMVRKAVVKLLNKLNTLSSKGYKLQDVVTALLSQSREIRTDHLHVPEAVSEFLDTEKSAATVNEILRLVNDERVPGAMVRGLVQSLLQYRDPSVLVGMKSLLSRVLSADSTDVQLQCMCLDRYDEVTAGLMTREKDLWNMFIKSLYKPSCQLHALALVSKKMFDALEGRELKEKVLTTCIQVYEQTKAMGVQAAGVQAAVAKLVKRVTLPAEIVAVVLNSPLSALDKDDSMKTKKMKRSRTAPAEVSSLGSVEWKEVRLLLEWIQNKKKIDNSKLLISPLFKLISQVLEMSEEVGSDYMKHLLLGCLDNVLTRLGSDTQEDVAADQLNIESIVQCIRTSKNPQTHQQALLLLRTMAKVYPNLVLHHVMSIFTYMGANIMRQDDMYSFQIITKTLDTVVPEIVKASDESGDYTITAIIRVFVDAYPHIPEHRRLPLFTKLLQTVDENKYLYACVCLCIENLTTSAAIIPESSNEYDWKTESNQLVFLLSLFTQFSVSSQLEACTRVLEFLSKLPSDLSQTTAKTAKKTPKKSSAGKSKSSISDGLFDSGVYTDKQLRHFKYECASFIVSLLSSSVFVEQVVNNEEESDLTSNFNQLVEMGLRYIGLVAKETSRYASHPTAKFWKALLHKAYEILDKVNALLPSQVFIDVISSLLGSDLVLIRRKAMDLLNNRLPQTVFDEEGMRSLIGLISLVKSIALDHTTSDEDTEDTTNRQTALYSLKIMARMLASSHIEPFLQLLMETCEAFGNVQLVAIRANILLLAGELMYQLKINALPALPNVVSQVLSTLQQDHILISNHLLWISALTALQKIVESMPGFLSQYLLDIVTIVCKQSSVVTSGGDTYKGYKAQLPLRLKTLRESVAAEFSPRVLVPILTKAYSDIMSHQSQSIEYLMGIVAEHIGHMAKEDLSSHHHGLLELFLLALDYRSVHHKEDPAVVQETEDSTIKATLKMIVKLSEAAFRPMYLKLYAWATRESEIGDRLITFYRLSDQVAETLRGLFSLFAPHIIKNASDVLNSANSSKADKSTLFQTSDHKGSKSLLLCKSVLNCLYKCFLYDTEGFVNKQRFDMLMQPLVDQLENTAEQGYEGYVKDTVVPCISQLALAVGDDSLWKPLIYQICLKTRHSSAEVRKGSLYVLRNLNSKLGEDFMTLLPETIPFLAELMEDDEEEVELLCQEVIADMESVLGEPLQKYF